MGGTLTLHVSWEARRVDLSALIQDMPVIVRLCRSACVIPAPFCWRFALPGDAVGREDDCRAETLNILQYQLRHSVRVLKQSSTMAAEHDRIGE